MSVIPHDIIEYLAGIEPTDKLHGIRQLRSTAKTEAQKSVENLFNATEIAHSGFSQNDRLLVAVFLAALHQQKAATEFYQGLLSEKAAEKLQVVLQEAKNNLTEGPYGYYPDGPLSSENQKGPQYEPSDYAKQVLGAYLAAALRHTHLLVFHLRDAQPKRLQQLIDAGWTTADIVTLSQLISFLSFQIRVATGLNVLAHATEPTLA